VVEAHPVLGGHGQSLAVFKAISPANGPLSGGHFLGSKMDPETAPRTLQMRKRLEQGLKQCH
jgi:hypothetical protein